MKTQDIILIIILAAVVTGAWGYYKIYHKPTQRIIAQGAQHHDIYYCAMHPNYTSDKQGTCPICGMTLILKHEHPTDATHMIPGYMTIDVSAKGQELAGIVTEMVMKKAMMKTIRAAGIYEGEVYAQVFEDDLPLIKRGQKAIVDMPAYHQQFEGEVGSIDPRVDENSRTIRVRIWLKHLDRRKIKTNMFVNVDFPVQLQESIIVPRQAVMDTGTRQIIFVQDKEGKFEPRMIQTGVDLDDGVEVKSGLNAGEKIVTSGNFLLDSEAQVQASLAGDKNHG